MFKQLASVLKRGKIDSNYWSLFKLSEKIALFDKGLIGSKNAKNLLKQLQLKSGNQSYTGKLFSFRNTEGISQTPLLIGEKLGIGGCNKTYRLYNNDLTPSGLVLKIPLRDSPFQNRLTTLSSLYNSKAIESAGLGKHIEKVVGIGKVGQSTAAVQTELPKNYFTLTTKKGRNVFNTGEGAMDDVNAHLPDKKTITPLWNMTTQARTKINNSLWKKYNLIRKNIIEKTGVDIGTDNTENVSTKIRFIGDKKLPLIYRSKVFDIIHNQNELGITNHLISDIKIGKNYTGL